MTATPALISGLGSNDATLATQVVRGTIVLTGNYGTGASHGDPLSFAGLYGLQSNYPPLDIGITETPAAGTAPTGYTFGYAPGTTRDNGQLTIMTSEGVEYTEGSAYSTALLNASLSFVAHFLLGQ